MKTISIILLAGLSAGTVTAAENVALGRPCLFDPPPDYPHCTDPGDAAQLTDGLLVEGYFWTQPGTVGWSGRSSVEISIDLGRVEPIGGASLRTAAGVAGVTWPEAIHLLESVDGKDWRLAGDLVAISAVAGQPPPAGYGVHRFRADLAARGRFVKLIIWGGDYIFADEVEVFRGAPALLEGPPPGEPAGIPEEFGRRMRTARALRRRLAADLAAVGEAVASAVAGGDERRRLEEELAAAGREIPAADPGPLEGFRTAFPIDGLHRRIFAVQAATWRAGGLGGLVAWPKGRWDPLSPTERPAPGPMALEADLMRGEHRGAAFNLSNAGVEDVRVRLDLEGLPGGRNPAWISVHEALFTDTRQGTPIAAALPLARRDGDGWSIEVPAGLTRQVWLDIHPEVVPAGDHRGTVTVEGLPPVPLRVKVRPLDFPRRPALHLGGWDYTDRPACYGATPENREALIGMLREHLVDTPWAQSAVMPPGTYDAAGNLTAPPPDGEFREWVRRWPGAGNYFVFAAVGESHGGFTMGTPEFRRAVGAWIRWWAAKLEEWGIEPGRLGLLLVDEPREPGHDRTIIEWARAIREAEPRVRIFEDPIWPDPSKGATEMFSLSHILCPNLPMWLDGGAAFGEFYRRQRSEGRHLWLYSCSGPGKLLDPYAYHRLQAWFAFREGAEGEGFWAFGDSNGSSCWNEYLAGIGSFSPLFLDSRSVTTGKHLEAVREGVEDFEALRMLRDRIEAAGRAGAGAGELEEARKVLAGAIESVTGPIASSKMLVWKEPKDREAADRARTAVLDALERLGRGEAR